MIDQICKAYAVFIMHNVLVYLFCDLFTVTAAFMAERLVIKDTAMVVVNLTDLNDSTALTALVLLSGLSLCVFICLAVFTHPNSSLYGLAIASPPPKMQQSKILFYSWYDLRANQRVDVEVSRVFPDNEMIHPVRLPHPTPDEVRPCREGDATESLGGEVDGVGGDKSAPSHAD